MLKGKNGQPFYKDFWFWVKILIFTVFLLFLVYPFSTLVINSFFSGKEEGFTFSILTASSPKNITTRPWATA